MASEDAVSPVIGTILLVALTLILVSIVALVVMGFNAGEPAPILGISIGQQGNIITVTQMNGATLPAGTYKILVDGVDKTAEFGGTVNFGPGMTLRWDSGTEAVGTVSVVYTGTNGGETVLAQKTIDKTGGGGDIKILKIGGVEYDLSFNWGNEWQNLRDIANATGSKTLVAKNVYYDDGKYWWTRGDFSLTLTKTMAENNPHIQKTLVGDISPSWIEIDTTRVVVSTDGDQIINSGVVTGIDFSTKPTEKITSGTLFCYDSKLYIWDQNFEASTFMFSEDYTNDGWGWKPIGTLSSA